MGVASIADRLLVARGRLHDDQRHPNATMIATFLANGAEVAAPSPDPSPMLLPHTICARGGRKGVVPMRDLRMDGVRLIFGSAHVSSRNPEWYSTLLLDPEVDLEQRTDMIPARAVPVHWTKHVAIFARRATRFDTFSTNAPRLERGIMGIRQDDRGT